MKYLYLIFILLFTLSNCKEKDNKVDVKSINIDIDKMNEISFFDIFNKIEIIPLETINESLMKEVQKVIYYNDNFFILDYNGQKIFSFDSSGNFRFKIDNKGQGPEQYINLVDFDIDQIENKLMFVSSVDATLHEYDLNGFFLHKYNLPDNLFNCREIKCINIDTIAFWTFDFENRLKLYSKKNNCIIKECMPEKNNFFNTQNIAFPSCNNNYFTKAVDNDIFEISHNGDISVAYTWDFGHLNIFPEKLEERRLGGNEAREFISKIFSSEVINYFFTALGCNSDYLYTQLIRKNKRINVFHNKKNKQGLVFEKTKENVYFYPAYWTDDFVIGYVPTHLPLVETDLEKVIPDTILDQKNIDKKNNLNEDDNPILMKYYFKK